MLSKFYFSLTFNGPSGNSYWSLHILFSCIFFFLKNSLKIPFCFFFSGVIYDLSNSYQIAFYAAGAFSTFATCLLFLVPVLMPKEISNDGSSHAETVQSEGSVEKPLLDGIRSPDSSIPTTSTKASLGSCQKLNSNMHLAPSQSYLDRYWDLPKRTSMRASMASLLSFSPVQPTREVLVVVEKVSQVWNTKHHLTCNSITTQSSKSSWNSLRVPSYWKSSTSSWFNTY